MKNIVSENTVFLLFCYFISFSTYGNSICREFPCCEKHKKNFSLHTLELVY